MTALEELRIVPAGAGSGKTYAIQHWLGELVAAGKVAPEKIAAVTYTEAAASELRERISTHLLELGRVDDALRLSEAYINTIHGFGLRVLVEFAFDAGASPRPRRLNQYEQTTIISNALATSEHAGEIAAKLEAFGYRYDGVRELSPGDLFRRAVLDAVDILRRIGALDGGRADELAKGALELITDRYGECADADEIGQSLRQAASALLSAYPSSMHTEFGKSQAASNAFHRDFGNLTRAAQAIGLDSDWKMWEELRALRTSRQSLPLPDGYDKLARAVQQAADALPCHPGPLKQAVTHLRGLLGAAGDALSGYEQAKRQAGLVDYEDMITMAARVLRENPIARDTLVSRIDCLAVDEFQDTNPLQFELLWQLREAGVPTFVVGDLKQAIMGFQGADPRLFKALVDKHQGQVEPLTRNWRSQPRLMQALNAFGQGLFPKDPEYEPLEPQAGDSPMEPLEILRFEENKKAGGRKARAYSLGERIRSLLQDPSQRVIDRATKDERPLRGADVAVLCRTHRELAVYAEQLRALGLRVNYQQEGWLESAAVQIAWHALSYLANPADRHAALYLAVTELGSLTLEEGLRQLIDRGTVEDPVLRKLDELSDGIADRTIYALVADTLAALQLFDHASLWPDGEQSRANLIRLMALAAEFMDSNREALAHGGYHGAGIQTFLAWLAERAADEDGDANVQPEKAVLEEDAVVLSTWHSAKGLEWPVVAVCQLDSIVKPRLPHLALEYESFDDLSRLVEHARLDYRPEYQISEQDASSMQDLFEREETEARRLLYVALTRARDRLILEWPEYLAKSMPKQGQTSGTAAVDELNESPCRYWYLLSGFCSLDLSGESLLVGGERIPCEVTKGRSLLPESDGEKEAESPRGLPNIGRRAIQPAEPPAEQTPDSRKPSEIEDEYASTAKLRQETYGDGLNPEVDLWGKDLGTFLHRCFEVLGSRPDLAERIPELTDEGASPAAVNAVAAAVQQFEDWLAESMDSQEVLREWPLLVLDKRGSVISGTADLIVRTAEGVWVIDHKSDNVDDPGEAFEGYGGQLDAYAGALAAQDMQVLGVGINWIRRGVVTLRDGYSTGS